jgi:DNA-binding GntR family transcriptional regulator
MVLDLTSFDRPKYLNVNAYQALRAAIATMNIYDDSAVLRFDERKLSEQLGINRTPLRDARARLDQDGIVKIVPRRRRVHNPQDQGGNHRDDRGVGGPRSLGRSPCRAACAQIAQLGRLLSEPSSARPVELVPAFHETLFQLAGNHLLLDLADGLLVHLRALWICAARRSDQAVSAAIEPIFDQLKSIQSAVQRRDADLAERLVRTRALSVSEYLGAPADQSCREGERDEPEDAP